MTADEAERQVRDEVDRLRSDAAALDAARERLMAAEQEMTQARDALHAQMRHTGLAFLSAGQPYPVDLMRELYWDYPEVHVDEIAHAFGLRSANLVSRTVGPDTRTMPCRNACGNTVTRNLQSRSAINAKAWRGSSDQRLCAACRERARADEEQRAAEHRRNSERQRAEMDAERTRLEQAIANGLKPTQVYASYPGFGRHSAWSLSSLQDVSELVETAPTSSADSNANDDGATR